jgi:hypothetical protein
MNNTFLLVRLAPSSKIRRRCLFTLAIGLSLIMIGCTKSVEWEEEVLLNTGETLIAKRYATYSFQGAGGNPLDMAYRSNWKETLTFEWKGRRYAYRGEADLMLLAISPLTNKPVLVANAANKQWSRENNYHCTTPFYVQFVPNDTNETWSWPPSIEPWLLGMPYNLMRTTPTLSDSKHRYSIKDKIVFDKEVISATHPSNSRIEPGFKFDKCAN